MSRRVRRHLVIAVISLIIFTTGAWQAINQQDSTSSQQTSESYADKLNPTPEPANDVKGAQAPPTTDTPPVLTPSTSVPQAQAAVNGLRSGPYRVASVSDGDTIRVEIDGKKQTVRLIGVDTPETSRPNTPVQCYARQASAFTKNRLTGKLVNLETDSRTNDKDRYGRLLRYVYLTDDSLVQTELLRDGYAFAYTRFPFSRSEAFVALQLEAQSGRKGLWRDCKPALSASGVYSTESTD